MASIQAVEPTILNVLTNIVKKKPAFDALPLGGISTIVLGDLKTLNTDTLAFADALISIAPVSISSVAQTFSFSPSPFFQEDLKDDSTTIKNELAAAFATAIAAYTP